jgi:hypothetical protein
LTRISIFNTIFAASSPPQPAPGFPGKPAGIECLQKGKAVTPSTQTMLRLSILVATIAAASAFTAPASFLRTSSRE